MHAGIVFWRCYVDMINYALSYFNEFPWVKIINIEDKIVKIGLFDE